MKKTRHTKKVEKKSKQQKKYPLRGKPIIYRDPFKPADLDEFPVSPRVPGIDKGKVAIPLGFDESLYEFDK